MSERTKDTRHQSRGLSTQDPSFSSDFAEKGKPVNKDINHGESLNAIDTD